MRPKRVSVYVTRSGRRPFFEFMSSLGDSRTVARIETRIRRAASGNLGDHRGIGGGVIELRLHFGPGYRLYVGLEGQELIVLLCGGDKSSQYEDVRRAVEYWHEHGGLQ